MSAVYWGSWTVVEVLDGMHCRYCGMLSAMVGVGWRGMASFYIAAWERARWVGVKAYGMDLWAWGVPAGVGNER
jgi:hypothetical protein